LLAGKFTLLAGALDALARGLGDRLRETTVVVLSEFGRTVRQNGNGGTDHGHGNVALPARRRGARRQGARDWPGLETAALYEGRDLPVTTDFRALLAEILEQRFRLGDRASPRCCPRRRRSASTQSRESRRSPGQRLPIVAGRLAAPAGTALRRAGCSRPGAHAVRPRGVRGQEGAARAARRLRHLLPQGDGRLRIEAGARAHLQAHEVRLDLVVAAELERQQLRADVGRHVAELAQAEQLRAEGQQRARALALGDAFARVLAQRMRDLVTHYHCELVVAEAELVDEAGEHGDLAPGMQKALTLSLPIRFTSHRQPRARGFQRGASAIRRRRSNAAAAAAGGFRGQRAFGAGLLQQLAVLLRGGLFELVGGHQGAQPRAFAHVDLADGGSGDDGAGCH
jgi:hypothetical protein